MLMQRRRWHFAYVVASLAILLGGYGVAFAGASKQGCTTRYRFMYAPPHHIMYCSGSCTGGGTCHPINLTNGLSICGCNGTAPSQHYDATGSSATTNCVDTIEVTSPEIWTQICQQGNCTNTCGQNYTYLVDGDPPEIVGQEWYCYCP
jgi:hypothetical protein